MDQRKRKMGDINPYRWMTTYTDLVTLLLTFFVLLISMSVIAKERRVAALSSVTGAFGVKPGGQSVIGSPKGENITIGSAPMVSEDMDLERLRNMVLKNSLPPGVTVQKEEERIIISLGNRLLFQPRSSKIESERISFLSDLRDVLKGSPSRVELRGFADTGESIMDSDPWKPATILAAKRAMALFHFLSEGGEIPAERIVAHGFGASPAPSGAESKSHQQNRQVQIILDYREKLPFRLTRAARNPTLDFKGFFFKLPGEQGGK
jgi:chemotaxis protein MotB